MEQFKPLGALKITVQKFYRISGGSTQYRGIVPDVILPDRFEAVKSGEQYIDYSMPWDTILSTKYAPLPDTLPTDQLKKNTQQRIANNEQMQHIIELAAKARQRIEHSQRSLTMADIIAERRTLLDDEKTDEELTHPGSSSSNDKDWQEKTHKDPYVLEAIKLIRDLQRLNWSRFS